MKLTWDQARASLFQFVYEILVQPRRRECMEAAKFWPDLSWLA